MGNFVSYEEPTSKLILLPAPCFPNTCEKHIQMGRDEQCEQCQVFKWYTDQEKALQHLAKRKLKLVKEQTENKRVDNTIKLVETSLEYISE